MLRKEKQIISQALLQLAAVHAVGQDSWLARANSRFPIGRCP